MKSRITRLAVFVALLALGAWGTFEFAVRSVALPSGLGAAPPVTLELTDFRGRPLAVVANARARDCRPVTLEAMGRWLPGATVRIEDQRFWKHGGIDVRALAGAAFRNAWKGRVISGASTITQQLIKLSCGTERRGKVYEALAAMKLERQWNKRRILAAYINRLDYGNRRIGPEAASLAYFGKPARELSLAESVYLAGLPQSPTRWNPWKNPEGAAARFARNAKNLSDPVVLPEVGQHVPPDEAPAFCAMVREAAPLSGRVTTTLDLDAQHMAERLLAAHLATVGAQGVGDAAVVILDNQTSEIRALATAGRPEHAGLNAALTPRSCGSTLKPFLYAQAIEGRTLTAASLLPDTPDAIRATYSDYDPRNYSPRYRGPVRLREALGNSLNVPAVVTLDGLGARAVFDRLADWGIRFPASFDAYGAGFILGNGPVRLVDLAGAFATLSRGGTALEPRVTPRAAGDLVRAAQPDACEIVTDILCDNNARRLSFGDSSPLHLKWRAAVKTGTSSGFRDGWCVGFSQNHTVGVWAGNLDGHPMNELLAVRSTAPLWAAIMTALFERGDAPVPEPHGLVKCEISALTGLLASPGEARVTEWFLPGSEPTRDSSTMMRDGRLVLPAEYAGWCASPQNFLGAVAESGNLRILFPKDGAVFLINSWLPAGQQTIPLTASEPDCDWRVNGRRVDTPRLPLRPGAWTITAGQGARTATASFTVEQD